MVTTAKLLELFTADLENGILYWSRRDRSQFKNDASHRSWNSRFAGKVAGAVNNRGYCEINIGGTLHLRHRLIWQIATGEVPEVIDHIEGVTVSDRISNLRNVSQADNLKNLSRQCRNKSGCTGVDWYEPSRKWRATIRSDGKRHHLGHFETKEAAIAARKSAEAQHGFHQNHGKSI